MAAKRIQYGSDKDPKQPDEKTDPHLPSPTMEIMEATMESFFRTLVKEELERVLVQRTGFYQWPSQAQTQEMEASSSGLQLIFQKPLSLPIFTDKKIETFDKTPLQILLTDTKNRLQNPPPLSLSSPLKLELVLIDGCFPPQGQEKWTGSEFDRHIVQKRDGKRPLITGELNLAMKAAEQSCCCSVGEIVITDNSCWIKSRRFRIGARVLRSSGYEGPRIMEALTEPFMVKDRRGESSMKHHPPCLTDEVWRLKKIAKGGTFHKRLTEESISTVQHFLSLLSVDPSRLRKILGKGMTDRMWEAIVTHARTCNLYRGSHKIIMAQNYTLAPQELNKSEMVLGAYEDWDMVENSNSIENLSMDEQSQHWYSETRQNTSLDFALEDIHEI